ncbi:MAG: DUF2961 domain-containing protein [Rikenellaceae bacterium]|nr:DUF2961 domain-containing protein [Rikenellaceae bacterium]
MKRILTTAFAAVLLSMPSAFAQKFDGLNTGMGNLFMLSNAQTRSICPENFTGEKGKAAMADPVKDADKPNQANARWAARDLGQTWKVNPFITIKPNETFTLAEIEGPGCIQSIWMTPTGNWKFSIIRIYWDDETEPSVECPVGDFFGMGWGDYAPLNSLAVCVNPGSAFNSYWQMPFRKKCKITMQNINDAHPMNLYYQVNYALTPVPEDAGYFHAQYRRSHPTEGALHTILDGVKGKGQFVGMYMGVQVNNKGWWGEGEVKFYMDGDTKFPTIASTGLEDYFCGSYNFDRGGRYVEFCTAYAGLHQVIRPDGTYNSQTRFGLYRWHILDPIRFEKDLKVDVQDLGWRHDGRYLPQQSDIITTAFWYQSEPHAKFPAFPSWQELEVN